MYVNGSLNVFNHRTNVNIENRIVAFDIKELGKQLKKLGMLIVQDQIWGRVTQNRSQGKATWYFCDEFHLLLREEQTAAFSCEIWKRFRKWGGVPTGATQNVKDLLSSPEIENILGEQRLYLLTKSGVRRPKNPCGTAEYFPAAATVCRQFGTRRGAFDLRERDPAL